mmetsp:Transcript_13058/g.21742  ORF Transcript_13058/g.21742 Transcript_13058/m.21742 type:complete len:204 (-) Transcript_13058:1525-2136(-)
MEIHSERWLRICGVRQKSQSIWVAVEHLEIVREALGVHRGIRERNMPSFPWILPPLSATSGPDEIHDSFSVKVALMLKFIREGGGSFCAAACALRCGVGLRVICCALVLILSVIIIESFIILPLEIFVIPENAAGLSGVRGGGIILCLLKILLIQCLCYIRRNHRGLLLLLDDEQQLQKRLEEGGEAPARALFCVQTVEEVLE